jgi:hypothetical protein
LWCLVDGDEMEAAPSSRNKVLRISLLLGVVFHGGGGGPVSCVSRVRLGLWISVFSGFFSFFIDGEVVSGGGGDHPAWFFSSSLSAPSGLIRYGVEGGPVHVENSSRSIHDDVKRIHGPGGHTR